MRTFVCLMTMRSAWKIVEMIVVGKIVDCVNQTCLAGAEGRIPLGREQAAGESLVSRSWIVAGSLGRSSCRQTSAPC